MIDYQALLKKYMALVEFSEGSTFVRRAEDSPHIFTGEELLELNRIEDGVLQERRQ